MQYWLQAEGGRVGEENDLEVEVDGKGLQDVRAERSAGTGTRELR